MKGSAKQRGFSLIELVVVITILDILAAFAVPRFARLEVQARIASQDALAGSVRAGTALSHTLWLTTNQPATVNMGGTNVAMTFGYPSRASIQLTLADTKGYGYNPATGVFSINGSTTCTLRYDPASTASMSPSIVMGGGAC